MRNLALLAAVALAAPAAAQAPIPVRAFDSIELVGGGEVIVRHGAEQRVTLLSSDRELAAFEVDGDNDLVIRACRRTCRNHNLRVEVVTPALDGIAITGGGRIRTEQGFAARGSIALAVTGGGDLDARTIRADSVAAAVRGGGRISTTAERSLVASVSGGGAIRYRGDPAKTVSIRGGGAVQPDR